MPTNFAVFDIFPPNFFICEIKYSFSNVSLASLSGTERVSVTEKFSSKDLDSDSFMIFIILPWLSPGDRIAIRSIKFLNSLTLPGQL